MSNLDTLRPEVRNALGAMVRADVCRDSVPTDAFDIIRAELVRLAVRNAELEAKATRDHEWVNDLLTENKKAEAELAALKARIARAPVYEIPLSKPKSEDGWARVIESVKNERSVRGKRVRLVVEE